MVVCFCSRRGPRARRYVASRVEAQSLFNWLAEGLADAGLIPISVGDLYGAEIEEAESLVERRSATGRTAARRLIADGGAIATAGFWALLTGLRLDQQVVEMRSPAGLLLQPAGGEDPRTCLRDDLNLLGRLSEVFDADRLDARSARPPANRQWASARRVREL